MTDARCRCYDGPEPARRAKCRLCGRFAGPAPRHACHAVGCAVAVPPKMLMCLAHWRMLPAALQKRVWDAYVPGQEIRKDPTARYLDVQAEAVAYVAKREGRA